MKILIISPPFSQLNSPYASLSFLQGFLKANGTDCSVVDLGIKMTNSMYSKEGLEKLRTYIEENQVYDQDARFFLDNFDKYFQSIDDLVLFLKGKTDRFDHDIPKWKMSSSALKKDISGLNDLDYNLYLASLYFEDIFLFFKTAAPGYGLSRYAESLSLSPPVFEIVRNGLDSVSFTDGFMISELEKCGLENYEIIAFTIPFPGTLTGALKVARHIRDKHPDKIIVFGGGYINTELRSLSDPGIFEFTDFICLDDGEVPLLRIIEFAKGKITKDQLVRTYCSEEGKVQFYDNSDQTFDINRGTPDYSDLDMDDYIPVYESVNPMMRLWSEKNTLKLRLARGCYWHRCAFCDTTLPYIKDYAPENTDDLIADIVKMVNQTGITRFHFTDEAIPPAVAIKLSVELIRQKIKITWWGNIRFDKAFTEDVCMLLKHAGCIAAVGGLESACGRTLSSMNKGVLIEDAVGVMRNFKSAGILVHAYMIYGFPTETAHDLIDSAEVLRQLFAAGLVDSAFWHRFALTVHSPVFTQREKYRISVPDPDPKPFANNDIEYIDGSGNEPDRFGGGLKKATYNFMLGIGLDKDINTWFAFRTPLPSVKKRFLRKILEKPLPLPDQSKKIIWLGGEVTLKGKIVIIEGLNGVIEYELPYKISNWLKKLMNSASVFSSDGIKVSEAAKTFPGYQGIKFSGFVANEIWDELFDAGLLIV
ncbi:MAG: radical SAM protein [Candidatus Delongbacteria bacterium]|nr:radical SAM protein [Candidatus Delongbacteria bacterium]